jgi:hypothetical protein
MLGSERATRAYCTESRGRQAPSRLSQTRIGRLARGKGTDSDRSGGLWGLALGELRELTSKQSRGRERCQRGCWGSVSFHSIDMARIGAQIKRSLDCIHEFQNMDTHSQRTLALC